jgi:hypothetical protein
MSNCTVYLTRYAVASKKYIDLHPFLVTINLVELKRRKLMIVKNYSVMKEIKRKR